MKILSRLPGHQTAEGPPQPPRTWPDAGALPPSGACGWFDSSHDLRLGLRVTEHASADAVAADLPLGGWLDLHLAGWQPQPLAG